MILRFLLMIPLCNFSHKINYVLGLIFILKGILFKKRLYSSDNCIMNVTFIISIEDFLPTNFCMQYLIFKLDFVLLRPTNFIVPFSLGMIQPNYSN